MEQPIDELKAIRLMNELRIQKKEVNRLWDILYDTYRKTPEYQTYSKAVKHLSEIEEQLKDMEL